ncbi:MAG: DUF2301 domain-containing membrane protein [Cyanobacteria bacterium J06642_2]
MAPQSSASQSDLEVYQGQFGNFVITDEDRREVVIYRAGLLVAALCFALGTGLALGVGTQSVVLSILTILYGLGCAALGISLVTIHIYMAPLHRALQLFWAIGCVGAIAVAATSNLPLLQTIYERPTVLWATGFTFAALTGIFIKEAFCFGRLETAILAPLVPILLMGHLAGILPDTVKPGLLALWAVLFLVFALRKCLQAIPPDIGDKSVFAYLKQQQKFRASAN